MSTGPLVPREPSSSPAWTPPRTTRSAQAPELPPQSPPPPPTVTGPTPPVHPVSCKLTARSLEAHPQPAPECVASGAGGHSHDPCGHCSPRTPSCVWAAGTRGPGPLGAQRLAFRRRPDAPTSPPAGEGMHSAVAGEAWCLQPREAVFAQFFSDRKMPAVPRNGTRAGERHTRFTHLAGSRRTKLYENNEERQVLALILLGRTLADPVCACARVCVRVVCVLEFSTISISRPFQSEPMHFLIKAAKARLPAACKVNLNLLRFGTKLHKTKRVRTARLALGHMVDCRELV